jgi:hypothetical protein
MALLGSSYRNEWGAEFDAARAFEPLSLERMDRPAMSGKPSHVRRATSSDVPRVTTGAENRASSVDVFIALCATIGT